MATKGVLSSFVAITRIEGTPMEERQNYSSAPERRSFCERKMQMRFSFGDDLSTTLGRQESIAQSSEMSHASDRQNSFVRRAILLGRSGLIAGVTPTSIRGKSEVQTLGSVFLLPGGGGVRT